MSSTTREFWDQREARQYMDEIQGQSGFISGECERVPYLERVRSGMIQYVPEWCYLRVRVWWTSEEKAGGFAGEQLF